MRFDPQSNFVPADNRPVGAYDGGASGVKTFFMLVLGLLVLAALGAGWMWVAAGPQWFEDVTAKVLGERPVESNRSPALAVTADLISASSNTLAGNETTPELDGSARTAFETGRVLLAKGQHADAVTHLAEAVRLEPEYADAHYKLGLAYVGTRDLEAARQEQSALEQLDPNLASLLGNLIR